MQAELPRSRWHAPSMLSATPASCSQQALCRPCMSKNAVRHQRPWQHKHNIAHTNRQLHVSPCCSSNTPPAGSATQAPEAPPVAPAATTPASNLQTGQNGNSNFSSLLEDAFANTVPNSVPSSQNQDAISSDPPPCPVACIQPMQAPQHLQQVASLRADAYYEDDRSRFAQSFKRQFANQEIESLQQRTRGQNGKAPQCECLVRITVIVIMHD